MPHHWMRKPLQEPAEFFLIFGKGSPGRPRGSRGDSRGNRELAGVECWNGNEGGLPPGGHRGEGLPDWTEGIYRDLRGIASRVMHGEAGLQTLQPTALVHELYLKWVRENPENLPASREELLALSGTVMRRILVDRARARKAQKRGGDWQRDPLDGCLEILEQTRGVDILEVHEALEHYQSESPDGARVVEMSIFGGLTQEEIARALGVSVRTVQTRWRIAKLWLHRQLEET